MPGHEFTGVVHSLGKDIGTIHCAGPSRRATASRSPSSTRAIAATGAFAASTTPARTASGATISSALDEYPFCDGGYAEYYYLPTGHYVFKVPDVLPDEAIPPVNCALCQVLYGIEQAEMKFGDIVVIQGAGGLGIYAAAVAAERGASRVISIDGQRPRLDLARQCGATDVIDLNEFPTPEARVSGQGPHRRPGRRHRVEVVGLAAATVEGLDMVRINGQYVDIGNIIAADGDAARDQDHHPADQVARRDPLRSVDHPRRARLAGPDAGQYPSSRVVSHSFPLAEINKAFEFAEWQGKNTGTAATRVILKA